MKVETDAVLVVFWRWEETVLRWCRPVRSFHMRSPSTRKVWRLNNGYFWCICCCVYIESQILTFT